MIQKYPHFQVHVSAVEPAPVRAADGWHLMDIRFLVNSTNAGAHEACFWRTVFKPGAAHYRHRHPNAAEILYVLRGLGAAGTEDREYEAPPGTAIYVPRGAVHWLRNLQPDEELEIVGVYAPGGSLKEAGYEFAGEITDEYRTVR